MTDVARYEWIGDLLQEAACVTLIAGATSADVLEAFGVDTAVVVPPEDAYGGGDVYFASVAVRDVPGGVVAVELNGFQGSVPEVLVGLSRLGRTASIFWNVNDDNAFSCASDGEVVASVDMYDAEDPSEVDLPADLVELFALAGDDEDGVSMWAVGLAMADAFTQVSVGEDDLRSASPFHPIRGA